MSRPNVADFIRAEETMAAAAVTITTVVHSHGSRYIIHVYENGKHTGNTYAAADEAHRDELLAIIAAA